MIRKNIYSRITESIVNAYHDNNLDSAMEDGHEMENMGKKIVAIITADPDQDLDWESEYEPFGATELTDDDDEAMEHEGIVTIDDADDEHELFPSCGYDVDCENDECDDDLEDMDVKEILIDILDELRDEDSEGEEKEENEMFGPYEDDESDDEETDEDEDADAMLAPQNDWASEESDDEEDDSEEEYDEEDFEDPVDEEDMDEILSAPTC